MASRRNLGRSRRQADYLYRESTTGGGFYRRTVERRRLDATHRRLVARIRELQRRKKMTAMRLADFAGIARGYLSDVLAGKKSPTVRTLVKLAAALDVEVRDLFS